MTEPSGLRALLAELVDAVDDIAIAMEDDGRDLTSIRSRLNLLKARVWDEGMETPARRNYMTELVRERIEKGGQDNGQ